MAVTGPDGRTLAETWTDGPVTYLGLGPAGLPNMIAISGPQSGSIATNFPRGIEEAVDWSTALRSAGRGERRKWTKLVP